MEELLPVGSIVVLKNKKLVMIIGYSPSAPLSEKQYDYIASNISGIKKSQEELRYNQDYFYFNINDIETVLYMGFSDVEFEFYKMVSKKLNRKIIKAKSKKQKLSEEDIKKVYEDSINEIKALLRSGKNEK